MKKLFLFAPVIALLLSSCDKGQSDCYAVAVKAPVSVAFKGFSAADFSTVVQNRYEKGSNYGQRLSTDTFHFSNVYLSGDTAFANAARANLRTIFYDADYEIIVPSAGRTFLVRELEYTTDTVVHWAPDHGKCGTYGSFIVQPQSLIVDGVQRGTEQLTSAGRWVTLVR